MNTRTAPATFHAEKQNPQRGTRARREARYVDGSTVKAGDHIRSRQSPGGILPPGGWRYGTAEPLADDQFAVELFLRDKNDGRLYRIYGHITERIVAL